MEGLVYLALVVGAFVAALAFRRWRRLRLPTWRRAAEEAGLAGVEVDEGGGVVLGRSGDLRVRIEVYPPGKSPTMPRIVVTGPAEGGLSLRREGLSTALDRHFIGEREIRIGEPSFDAELFVQGETPLALALLDAGTRAALSALMRDNLVTRAGDSVNVRAWLSRGVLEVLVGEDPSSANPRRAGDVIAAVVELARRLVPPADVAARLEENLRAEPHAGVRLECLATLVREFPSHPATREALLRAREDADVEVRLQAGLALGREGRDIVFAIARGNCGPDETSARAVTALAGDLSAEEAADVLLSSALFARRLATSRECLRVLGERRDERVVPTLAKVLAVEEGELAEAAAGALGAAGDAAAEAPLVAALGRSAWKVREAAARALGRVGTIAAVQPLHELERSDGWCRAAARQAIAEIQSRLTGAEHGQLSLAGGEAGQLSIADGEEGRLSLSDGSETREPSRPGQTGVARGANQVLRDPGEGSSTR